MTFANRNRGGSGHYARSLLAAMLKREDVAVRAIAGPSTPNFPGTVQWLLRGGRSAVTATLPNVLHCPTFAAPLSISVPVVITTHDAAARRFPGDLPIEWRIYDRLVLPRTLRGAARIIAVSEFARREVISKYGLDPDRVVVVHNGLDLRFFTEQRKSRPINKQGPLLFPGAPASRKNLEIVLRCMAGAGDDTELGRVSLEISGACEESYPKQSQLVRSLGLQRRVSWLGQVRDDDMPALMQRARIVVYPSLYEGFGFPPLEAMASGTPVVASNRGSLPEVLNGAALLVDPTDERAVREAIEAVLTRTDLRERLRNAGWRQANIYTWANCLDKTIDVYREACESTGTLP